MKKSVLKIAASFLFLLLPIFLSGQKSGFNGTWNLDKSRIPVTDNFPVLTKIVVIINGDSLLTERIYDNGDGQVYPFRENLILNGKENTITVYDMPRKAKATWNEKNGALVHEAITTANGSDGPIDFKSTETWTVDPGNNILKISFLNKIRESESTGTFFFNKSLEAN